MRICLDAGHSGKTNPYYVNGKMIGSEGEMAWKLHLLLREKLRAAGAEVICTRSTFEQDIELVTRGKKSEGCDLFLSLHSNAGSETADYPLACCQVDGSSDEIGLKLARAVDEVMQTMQSARIWKRDYQTGGGGMIQLSTDPNYGKQTAVKDYYGVLRGSDEAGVPGVLLECSFHSNPVMARWLTDESNLDKLAAALCKVIVCHFDEKEQDWKKEYLALREKHNNLIDGLTELLDRLKGGV